MRAMATKRWPKEVLTSGGRCRPYREINFSRCVGFVTRRISIGKLFPFSGKLSVVRTVWECHANSDNDFCIATQRPVNAKSFVRLTVVRHVRFPFCPQSRYAHRTRIEREIVHRVRYRTDPANLRPSRVLP